MRRSNDRLTDTRWRALKSTVGQCSRRTVERASATQPSLGQGIPLGVVCRERHHPAIVGVLAELGFGDRWRHPPLVIVVGNADG